MVLDGAGWHRNSSVRLPENLRLLTLPPYAPEINPVEHIWDELREKWFHNTVFQSHDALEDRLEKALLSMEQSPTKVQPIVAWPWIINALMI